MLRFSSGSAADELGAGDVTCLTTVSQVHGWGGGGAYSWLRAWSPESPNQGLLGQIHRTRF